MKSKIYENLPPLIKSLLLVSKGWLVGGAPRDLVNGKTPNDWDIIVPSRELFQITMSTINPYGSGVGLELNTFGGLKCTVDLDDGSTLVLDIWCEELDHFVKTANKRDLYFNLKRYILLKNED